MATTRHGAATDIEYLVLPNSTNPYLLARVRWPDVFQAISPTRPDWQSDPGLFDLPYAPNSVLISTDEATALAAEWGADLPPADADAARFPSLIRRMPADWSSLAPAERRAWSIEPVASATDARTRRGRWRVRRRSASAVAVDDASVDEVAMDEVAMDATSVDATVTGEVIDLTGTHDETVIDLTGTHDETEEAAHDDAAS